MLWVALAGGVRAEVDGRLVDDGLLGGRQGRRLLARLAWEGRAVHRDELADGIWLERLPRTWERTLSGVITRLRIGLTDAGVLGDVITFVDGRYSLIGGGDVHIDVRDAGHDLVAAREAADRGDLECARLLADGVLQVARLPLLPGEDAEWVDVARIRHRTLLQDALDVVVDAGLRAGSYALAEGAAREAVHSEPLREAGHQRLLGVLAAQGDHAAVVTAYSACRQLLVEELGLSPSPETDAIYRQSLGAEPGDVDVASDHGAPTFGRSRTPFPVSLGEYATTLVGRESALVWLWSLWRKARMGAPLTVIIHGPPGAGKRSLAAVFAREVYAASGEVAYRGFDGDDPTAVGQSVRRARSASLLAVLELPEGTSGDLLFEGAALVLVLSTGRLADGVSDAAVALGPLDRVSVAALADESFGRSAGSDEVDELCATTGGWPGAVVGKLSELAEGRARLLAAEAALARASLTSAHVDLADEIMRSRARTVVSSRQPTGRVPYKGLLRFEPEDSDLFFGREQLVADVLARLSVGRLVIVMGASGSGKSSVVRAGVIAELRRGALPGSDLWPVVLLTPGREPMAMLTSCLQSATASSTEAGMDEVLDELDRLSPSVVVVDQFEELFTLGTAEAERVAFADSLVRGLADGTPGHRVVIALRSDFYDALGELPRLTEAVVGAPVIIHPPTELELRRIVSFPARAAGVVLEPGLVDEVIADTRAAPGALPLVSTAMLGAWSQRNGSMMTIDGYRAVGGVAGAIATLAEDVWSVLDPAEQRWARSMILRLSGGEETAVNNPVRRAELVPIDDVVAGHVLDQLVHRRLIAIDDDTVRLAHEALLREWPRVRAWLAEDRAVREGLQHLRHAASEWERRGHDAADLYRGTRLAAGLELGVDVELSAVEQSFLDASVGLQRAELQGLKRRSHRLRALSVVLVVLLVVSALVGAIAVTRQREATDQARLALAQLLAREADSANGLDLRLLLAVESRRLEDSPEARGALLNQLTRAGGVAGFLRGGPDNLSAVAVSESGTLLATGGTNGTVSMWRLPDFSPLGAVALVDGRISALALSADGELAAGSDNGDVARWRPGDANPVRFGAHTEAVVAVGYRRDGSLVTAGRDGLLRSFSVATGKELWSTSLPRQAVAGGFDGDGSRYAQIGEDAKLTVIDIDASGGRAVPTAGFASSIEPTALALSADGRTVAVGDRSTGVHVLELDTGATAELGRLASGDVIEGSTTGVEKLVFTAAGELLATAGGAIGRFDVAGKSTAGTVQLVGGRVTGLAVDPTGATAAAVTETGETVLLELDRSNLARPLSNAGQPVTALTVDTGGTVAAAGDSQVALLDFVTGNRRVLTVPGHPVSAVSSMGGLLATGGRDSSILTGTASHTVIDIKKGSRVIGHDWFFAVTAVALHPGGELLAIGDERGQVRLLDVRTARGIHDLQSLPAATAALAFTATGDRLVGVAVDGTIVAWNPQGQPIGQPIQLGSPATALALTLDGHTAAVATADGAVIVDLATGRVRASLASPFGRVESVSFGLDGTILATGGSGKVLLWDVATGRRLGDPLPAPGNTVVAFDAKGRNLVTGGADGEVVVWEVDPDRWVELACAVAGRTLSRDEWRRYMGNRAYDPACG